MSYKVVQVNGPTGDPTDVSKHITDGYAPVGGVSAAFNASENKMKYFQGMYKLSESTVFDPSRGEPHFGQSARPDAAAAMARETGIPISFMSGKGGRRTRRK